MPQKQVSYNSNNGSEQVNTSAKAFSLGVESMLDIVAMISV